MTQEREEKSVVQEDEEPRGIIKESSQIFRRNRALGYVSNQVPAVTRYVQRRRDNLLITCIGRSFQVYTASHFRLLHVSGLHPDDITAMATDRVHTYTASNKCIYAWRAGKHIRHIYRGHERDVHLLLPFGNNLIAVDHANVLKVWNIGTDDVYLDVPFQPEEFHITAIAHPPTYINKIVLGSRQGSVKILNIKKNVILCTFNHHRKRVTCIEPAPALDVVAVGYRDGTIIILNLKFDEVLVTFKQDWGMVSGLTFRTDGPPILVSACSNGNLAFWNLEDRKLAGQLQAHEQAVTTAICLPSEPVVFTTSPDNSMKTFVFDMPDGGARQLRIREGHTKPPLCIRYHGANGNSILSSGEDSTMRMFSTISESLNRGMGRATYSQKATKRKSMFNRIFLSKFFINYALFLLPQIALSSISMPCHPYVSSPQMWHARRNGITLSASTWASYRPPLGRSTSAAWVNIVWCRSSFRTEIASISRVKLLVLS